MMNDKCTTSLTFTACSIAHEARVTFAGKSSKAISTCCIAITGIQIHVKSIITLIDICKKKKRDNFRLYDQQFKFYVTFSLLEIFFYST